MREPLRLAYDAASQTQRIDFAPERPRLLTLAFTALWLAGWLFLLTLTFLEYVRFGRLSVLSVALLIGGGVPVAIAWLWAALGKRESLLVTPSELRTVRWAGPIRLSRSVIASDIVALRPAIAPRGFFADLMAIRQFYSGGRGSLVIDTTSRTFSVGHTLPDEAAAEIIEDVYRLMPQLKTHSSEIIKPRRRAADFAAGFMTVTMFGVAFTMPGRLAIVDRPICFYDDSVMPRDPIDVSLLHPAGRVFLVPIEDFPVERATAIAEHFRTRFGVAIDVAPAMQWPEGAYVESRRQMDSAMMLTRLESHYAASAAPPAVAIALTTRDMFNSDVNWGYVFSYRRRNRVAVVSPARMDRGCMGVFQADEDRIMARLRKMVGKNIGIMYFGLEMSADPASMLYRNIGGPQELDAMSERF